MKRRLGVVAHWDPDGLVAPHVLRQLESLANVCEELVVATTSILEPGARRAISDRARVVERENVGQDFAGWADVMSRTDLSRFEEVLLTNDTYVGPLVDSRSLFAAMDAADGEFWGTHASQRISPHLQSFFIVLTEPVLRSRAFDRFWTGFRPAVDRNDAIRRQEIGLSRTLLAAGFALSSYYRPNARDLALAPRREDWWKTQLTALRRAHGRPITRALRSRGDSLNHAVAFADAALDDARMPLVKFDTLRYDPYFLGSGHLLTLCEQRFPEHFEGVREYLERTAAAYQPRADCPSGPLGATLDTATQLDVGYHAPQRSTP